MHHVSAFHYCFNPALFGREILSGLSQVNLQVVVMRCLNLVVNEKQVATGTSEEIILVSKMLTFADYKKDSI
jgi:hypothetical protein